MLSTEPGAGQYVAGQLSFNPMRSKLFTPRFAERWQSAAAPPCGELGETGAYATWLARRGRGDLPETSANETWLARYGEKRADPLGGAPGEAEQVREPLRLDN